VVSLFISRLLFLSDRVYGRGYRTPRGWLLHGPMQVSQRGGVAHDHWAVGNHAGAEDAQGSTTVAALGTADLHRIQPR
jgi:hypothetical protein